ncbi:MAG: type II secretion system protein GspG [Limisphaerales bacterium]
MKKRDLAIIFCVLGLFLFCLLGIFNAAGKYSKENNTIRKIQELALALRIYSADHGKYPPSLEKLSMQSDNQTRSSIDQILHDPQNHNYDYQPKTNGFVVTVTSPDRWFGKGDHYLVEFEESTNHTLLKLNGAVLSESWIGDH